MRSKGYETRAQTLHDYVAGVSVFVLTVALVLSLLPSAIAPYRVGGSTADTAAANRIGTQVVSNLSVDGAPNTLNATGLASLLSTTEGPLRTRYGLTSSTHLNISLVSLNGSVQHQAAGASAAGEETSNAARIVQLAPPGPCTPACRLRVRVW